MHLTMALVRAFQGAQDYSTTFNTFFLGDRMVRNFNGLLSVGFVPSSNSLAPFGVRAIYYSETTVLCSPLSGFPLLVSGDEIAVCERWDESSNAWHVRRADGRLQLASPEQLIALGRIHGAETGAATTREGGRKEDGGLEVRKEQLKTGVWPDLGFL